MYDRRNSAMPSGWARALCLLAAAWAVLAQVPANPCTWNGSAAVCTGTLQGYDLEWLLGDALGYSSDGYPSVSITLRGVNMTGVQLSFLRAAAFSGAAADRTFAISIENSVVAKNQLMIFGALAAQAGITLNLQISNSTVADNQLVLAAGLASGKAVKAAVNSVGSTVRGNMMATAGGLALSTTLDISAAGNGGSATDNSVAAAGFLASGGTYGGTVSVETIYGSNNGVAGIGLPFIEEPLVASIINTVMNAVFVDSSSLSTGLANTQTQLCASLAAGGSLNSLLTFDLGLSSVRSIAWMLLCDPSSASHVNLSDLPGMIDGTAGTGAAGTLRALHLLASGKGHVRVKSLRSALAFAANHPTAFGDLLHALTVEERT